MGFHGEMADSSPRAGNEQNQSKIFPNQTVRKPSKTITVMSKRFKSQFEEVLVGNGSAPLFIIYLKSNLFWAEALICWCKTLVLFLLRRGNPYRKKGGKLKAV